MKITTYNQDGSIKSEEVVELVIPDYLMKFDDSYPILDITEDEYRLICNEDESFAKTLLIDKFQLLLQYDYELYHKDVECHLVKPDISDNTYLMLDFFGISTNLIGKLNIHLSDEDSMFWEEVLSPNKEDECEVICKILAYADKLYEELIWIKKRVDNGRKHLAYDTLQELCEALHILKVIKDTIFEYGTETRILNANGFVKNLIIALYGNNDLKRSKFYHVLSGMETACPNSMVAFTQITVPRRTNSYDIFLWNDFGEHQGFQLSHQELVSITKEENAHTLAIIKGYFESIQIDYQANKKTSWTSETDMLYDTFTYKHPEANGDWAVFEKEFRSTLLYQPPISTYKPQECYWKLVAAQKPLANNIGFTSDFIADLLLLLSTGSNSKENQSGLYKTLYQFNYILGNKVIASQSQDVYDSPIQKALDYVEPLFENKTFVLPYNRTSIKQLVHEILTSDELLYLSIEKPNGFKGGFNLTLVYNILGYLHTAKQHLIQGDGKSIDKYLGQKYCEANGLKFSERKHYINDYNDPKYYFLQNREVIDSIIQRHKSQNKSL